MYLELCVQSWSYCCRIVRASNGLGQLGLAKTRPSRERCRGHSIGTPVLKSLWLFRIAYLNSFSEATVHRSAEPRKSSASECFISVVMVASLPLVPLIGKYHRHPAI